MKRDRGPEGFRLYAQRFLYMETPNKEGSRKFGPKHSTLQLAQNRGFKERDFWSINSGIEGFLWFVTYWMQTQPQLPKKIAWIRVRFNLYVQVVASPNFISTSFCATLYCSVLLWAPPWSCLAVVLSSVYFGQTSNMDITYNPWINEVLTLGLCSSKWPQREVTFRPT